MNTAKRLWDRSDRQIYLDLCEWLRSRYAVNGSVVISKGTEYSRYAILEKMAFDKYILGN